MKGSVQTALGKAAGMWQPMEQDPIELTNTPTLPNCLADGAFKESFYNGSEI